MRSSVLAFAALALTLGVLACVADDPVVSTPAQPLPDGGSTASSGAGTSSGSTTSSSSGGTSSSASSSGAEPDNKPRLFLFLTSSRYDGARGGIEKVDQICQDAGSKLRTAGTFKAWLGGTMRQDMRDLLPPGRTWEAADRKTILATTADLLGGEGLKGDGLKLTDKLEAASEQAGVWTNIYATGKAGVASCKDWTVADATQGAVSRAGTPGTAWTEDAANRSDCAVENHFACIEIP